MTCKTSRISSRWTAGDLPCAVFPPLPLPDSPTLFSRSSGGAIPGKGQEEDARTSHVRPPRFKPSKHHHKDDTIQANPTKPVLPPPSKAQTTMSSERHHTPAQIVDVDVDDGTVSSNTSKASTRSNPSIYGDDEAELDIPQVLIVRGLEDARHGVYLKFLEMLEERQVKWVEDFIINQATPSGDDPVDPMVRPEEGKRDRSQPLPEGFFVIYVRPCLAPRLVRQQARSLRTSQRREGHKGTKRQTEASVASEGGGIRVPGWFLDKFALSCLAAEETVLRAAEINSDSWHNHSRQDKALIDGKVRPRQGRVDSRDASVLTSSYPCSCSALSVDSPKRRICIHLYVSGYPT